MAAKFEFEDLKDVSSARVLLQQGLRANPTSKHLWIEVGCGMGEWEGGREGGCGMGEWEGGREMGECEGRPGGVEWEGGRVGGREKEGRVEWSGREWERRMGRVGIGWQVSGRVWGEYEGR